MEFSHYTAEPLTEIWNLPSEPATYRRFHKPTGLWLAIDGEHDWPKWCISEGWNIERLAKRYKINLHPEAQIIRLTDEKEVIEFSKRFNMRVMNSAGSGRIYYLNWPKIRTLAAGIVFSGWNFSMHWSNDENLSWVYGWDVPSACIWNAQAIESFVEDLEWRAPQVINRNGDT